MRFTLHSVTSLILLSMNPTLAKTSGSKQQAPDDQLNQKSSIQLVSGKSYDSSGARFYQRFVEEIPLHGARVFAESDGDDFLIPGLDQFEDPDTFDATYPVISMDLATTVAEANVDFAIDSSVTMVWFQINSTATLCWEVVTTLADLGEPVSPTHMEAIVDGQTGDLLSQRQIDVNDYTPSDFTYKPNGVSSQDCRQQCHGYFREDVPTGSPLMQWYPSTVVAPVRLLLQMWCCALVTAASRTRNSGHLWSNLNGGGLVFRSVQSSFLPDGGITFGRR